MQTHMALDIALVAHGNLAIFSNVDSGFFPGHSTCAFCTSVSFYEHNKPPATASSPDDWFKNLRVRGASGLKLRTIMRGVSPDEERMTAGMVGGGRWLGIEVIFADGHSEYWRGSWKPADTPDGRRVWQVGYFLMSSGPTETGPAEDLHKAYFDLAYAILGARSFASFTPEVAKFQDNLDKAMTALFGDTKAFHPDLLPESGQPREAVKIINAAQHAWVFGGEGSWNDAPIQDTALRNFYDDTSNTLFEALNNAIVTAAGAGFKGA